MSLTLRQEAREGRHSSEQASEPTALKAAPPPVDGSERSRRRCLRPPLLCTAARKPRRGSPPVIECECAQTLFGEGQQRKRA